MMKKQKNKHYVYVLLDPRKIGKFCYEGLSMSFLYEPFYIGKGQAYRIDAHVYEALHGKFCS